MTFVMAEGEKKMKKNIHPNYVLAEIHLKQNQLKKIFKLKYAQNVILFILENKH